MADVKVYAIACEDNLSAQQLMTLIHGAGQHAGIIHNRIVIVGPTTEDIRNKLTGNFKVYEAASLQLALEAACDGEKLWAIDYSEPTPGKEKGHAYIGEREIEKMSCLICKAKPYEKDLRLITVGGPIVGLSICADDAKMMGSYFTKLGNRPNKSKVEIPTIKGELPERYRDVKQQSADNSHGSD